MPSRNNRLTAGVYRRTTSDSATPSPPGAPSASDLTAALETVRSVLAPTPTLLSPRLSRRWDREVFVKYENLSPVRSFKARGALIAIAALVSRGDARGATTASTGNHGQGLAFAGRHFDVPVTVVIPEGAEPAKLAALEDLGASLEVSGANLTESQVRAERLADELGLLFIEDGEDPWLMAGAATLITEMVDQVPDLETVIIPVGGGNLIAGTLLGTALTGNQLTVVGVQSSAAPGATDSWLAGEVVVAPCETFAGGLATEYPGGASLHVMMALLETMILVSDEDLWRAIATVFDATGAAVEGAAAAGVASLDRFGDDIPGERIGIVLSGGWISRVDLVRALAPK